MEKPQVNYINQNITRLIDCTKDEDTWFSYLLQYRFLSSETWETIKNTHHNRHSRIREIYQECSKTPRYDLLIESLKESNNPYAAIILEDFYAGSSSASKIISKENLISFDIQQGTKYYKGREDELQTIHNYYLEASRDNSLILVGITGLGGIGKTELARNYAKKFYSEGLGHCIWLNAETGTSFSDSISRLAKQMRISLVDAFGKEKTSESLTLEFYEQFSEVKYLVVFDNLESYEAVFLEHFVEYALKFPLSRAKPFALMTSRSQSMNKLFGELVKKVDLTILSESSALSFFKDALDISFESDEIVFGLKKLCSLLDNLPLAMQQAAAYINVQKEISDVSTEIKDYLESFESERKTLLSHPLPKFMFRDEFSTTTFYTWKITLEKLELTTGVVPLAKLALNVISFLNSDNIPVNFLKGIMNFCALLEFGTVSNNREMDIFGILAEYSMCQRRKIDGEICVSVHRLVQMVTQINLQEEEKWVEMLNTLLQILNDNFDDIISVGNISQIKSLLNHTRNNTSKISNKHKYFELFERIHTLYTTKGMYREGCEFNSFAIEQLEDLFGKESRETLLMMAFKGKTLHLTGEYETAQDILQNVQNQQKIIRTSYASEIDKLERDLLYTKTVIAEVNKDQGNYKAALKLNLEVFEVRKSTIGIDHPDTLKNQRNIARIYESIGNYDKALELSLEVLESRKRVLGNEHPDTLTTKYEITEIYIFQQKHEEAMTILLEMLEVQQRVTGIEHPDTLNTKHNIADVYCRQGYYDKALEMFMEVLGAQQRVIGSEHPDTLMTKHNIAFAYEGQGNNDKALKMYFEVLEVKQRVLGMEHPDTLMTKHNIAHIYGAKGNCDKALEMLLEVLETQQRVIGMEHPHTLLTKHKIAFAYGGQGDSDNSLKLYLEVLEARQRVIGMEHPDTLTTKQNIAFTHDKQGNYDQALKIYLEVLEVKQRVIGLEHPDTVLTKNNVAYLHNRQGNYEKALEIGLEVLEVRQRVMGMEHPDTLTIKHNIAFAYDGQGDSNKALEIYFEVLEVKQRVMGIEHPDTLMTKHNIASVYNRQGNYEKALEVGLEVLEVRQRVIGTEHPDTLMTKNNIAFTYDVQGNSDKALEMYLEVLEVEKRVLGIEHPNTLTTKRNVIKIYNTKDNYEDSPKMFL